MIVSERTVMRPFSPPEADELLPVFQDPAVRRYLLDDTIVSKAWMEKEIAASDARFAQSGTGLWSVSFKGQTGIIGFVGFREFFDPPQLQLMYGLLPDYWGQGFATEIANQICGHAFETLGLNVINAATDVPNEASIRVLERLGMRRLKIQTEDQSDTAFFILNRDDWIAAQRNGAGEWHFPLN
ncbi:MAG: GNAT family N-acetyltransferase [Gammaproteobacteria bacterium]|nr:GNAT family N-acetyltransferase [Gammaproteobacteria bacterium]